MANLKRELALEGIITTRKTFKSITVFLSVFLMVHNTQCTWLPADWATKESFKSPLSVSWWYIGWEWWADCFLHTKKTFGTENDNDGATVYNELSWTFITARYCQAICDANRQESGVVHAALGTFHCVMSPLRMSPHFNYSVTAGNALGGRRPQENSNTSTGTCKRPMSGLALPNKELHTL